MPTVIDTAKLSAHIKTKRVRQGLRDAAAAIGDISASTLSRIEHGKVPDMPVYLRICDWLGVGPATFFVSDDDAPTPDTLQVIEAHLRADENLDPATAEALAQMIRAAYKINRTDGNS